jgi:hypothetical protein
LPTREPARGLHAKSEISMSLSAIDAMLRERRLAAMRDEIEQSLDAPRQEGQPGHGYDPNQLLFENNPDAESWPSPGMAPGTEPAAAAPPYKFPVLAPTMNVAMKRWPTGVWQRQARPRHFPTFGSHGCEVLRRA